VNWAGLSIVVGLLVLAGMTMPYGIAILALLGFLMWVS
jgi:hypothetical protein